MNARYWHVDAFASCAFAGNPAAVLLLDQMPDAGLLATIAAEFNRPATAFLAKDKSGVADYSIRWFSPTGEIGLCGHGTLAAGHAILSEIENEQVWFRTHGAGNVEVRRALKGYEMSFPTIVTEPGDRPEFERLFRVRPLEIWLSPDRYGIYLFESERQIRSLSPDFATLAKLDNDQFICTAPGDNTDIVSRVFKGGAGSKEDSVTGSAHAALAPFWVPRLGRLEMTAHQASGRGGDLSLRLVQNADGNRVWIGGKCETLVEGKFHLSG